MKSNQQVVFNRRLTLGRAVKLITPDPETLGKIQREYALSYMKSEQVRPAGELYLQAWETDSSKYSVLSNIAYCYERLKDWKKAEKSYLISNTESHGSSGRKYAEDTLGYVRPAAVYGRVNP